MEQTKNLEIFGPQNSNFKTQASQSEILLIKKKVSVEV